MYICPTCNKKCVTEEEIKKHSMACWRKANPHYKSKTPPHGETIITRCINDDIYDFFNSLKDVKQDDGKS